MLPFLWKLPCRVLGVFITRTYKTKRSLGPFGCLYLGEHEEASAGLQLQGTNDSGLFPAEALEDPLLSLLGGPRILIPRSGSEACRLKLEESPE